MRDTSPHHPTGQREPKPASQLTELGCFRRFHLGRSREAFDPVLVIAIQRAGILAPDQFKEEVALLRLLGQQMRPFIRRSDDPAVLSGRTGLIAIHYRRPRELTTRYEFGNDEAHRIANRHPVEFGSECQFRFTAQDLDLIFRGKMTRPIPGIDEQLPNHFRAGLSRQCR